MSIGGPFDKVLPRNERGDYTCHVVPKADGRERHERVVHRYPVIPFLVVSDDEGRKDDERDDARAEVHADLHCHTGPSRLQGREFLGVLGLFVLLGFVLFVAPDGLLENVPKVQPELSEENSVKGNADQCVAHRQHATPGGRWDQISVTWRWLMN